MDIVIVGAGAAGLFCAALLGQKGHRVTVIEGGVQPGRKLLLSGGGRCNFTNMNISAYNYISSNSHFCKSAISRYTQYDFIDMLGEHGIAYEERMHGQLFCAGPASGILEMLLYGCSKGCVSMKYGSAVESAKYDGGRFIIKLSSGNINADKLIVATGGLSLPKTGATPVGYKIAESFGVPVTPVRAGLVPLTLDRPLLNVLANLSGIAVPTVVTAECGIAFREQMLFTHRGLSGPVILQISNYWSPGESITINLFPGIDVEKLIISEQQQAPNRSVKSALIKYLPKSLSDSLVTLGLMPDMPLNRLTVHDRRKLVDNLTKWKIKPNGTEGYRTAEVTLGGVDTNYLSSRTMACKLNENLYFIGEVVDVTGWLGGYNLQWCWSSAWACADGMF